VVRLQLAAAGANHVASGSFTIRRLDFKVGEDEWADTSMLANDVQVCASGSRSPACRRSDPFPLPSTPPPHGIPMNRLITAAACAAALTAAHADGGSYAIDPTHTFVSFEVMHRGTSTHRARFDRKEGTVQFDRRARSGRVEISIDMNSINSGVPAFDSHLRSKDLLDVARTRPPASSATGSPSSKTVSPRSPAR